MGIKKILESDGKADIKHPRRLDHALLTELETYCVMLSDWM